MGKLLHSIARNRALIDGNKRLALAAVIAFYGLNGRRLTLTNDQAYDLVISVAPANSTRLTPSRPSCGTPQSPAGKAHRRTARPSPRSPTLRRPGRADGPVARGAYHPNRGMCSV